MLTCAPLLLLQGLKRTPTRIPGSSGQADPKCEDPKCE